MSATKAAGPVGGTAAVEAYLAGVSEPYRTALEKLRAVIRDAAPAEAEECMTYSMPGLYCKGVLLSYAAFKKHCSLFPMSATLLDDLGEEAAPWKTSKGTLQFSPQKPLDDTLVKRIVAARVAQNEGRVRRKA